MFYEPTLHPAPASHSKSCPHGCCHSWKHLCKRALEAWRALVSPAAHSQSGLEAPQNQWFHLRDNAAQLHPTSNGWTCLPGPSRTREAVLLSLCLCQALPIRLALLIFAPHSFPRAKADLGSHLWWLLFLSSLPQRQEKACSEPVQGELNQGSFPSVEHQPSPCQRVPGPSLFPSSQSPAAHPSLPRLLIPSIPAHTTCVLPGISGCKREAKLQVGSGFVAITREERGEIRPTIKGRVCPGMRFWNKVTGKCCCLRCPLKFSCVLSLPHHSPPPPCARSEVKVYFWLPWKGQGWGETGFVPGWVAGWSLPQLNRAAPLPAAGPGPAWLSWRS